VKRLINEVEEKQGKVEILVNNAGIHKEGNLETTSYEDWRRVLNVNLDGFLGLMRAHTSHMKSLHRYEGLLDKKDYLLLPFLGVHFSEPSVLVKGNI